MPPKSDEITVIKRSESDTELNKTSATNPTNAANAVKESNFEPKIVWRNVYVFAVLHLFALIGVFRIFYCQWTTLFFAFILYAMGGLGITAGAHRLWAHRTYKAKLPLRMFLGFCQTLAVQNSIYEWSRDHRVHHKHSETDADPHNAKRGFFFSHVGWLLMKKHPEVFRKGSKIPMDDLLLDPVVYYQKKYYRPLAILVCFVMPTVVPVFLWNESWINAYFVPAILRYIVTLHVTWLVNSIAHMWGWKPYDKRINPVENLFVSIGALGEGFHNYHHTFPQDYATSEFGAVYFNFTKGFIDFMSRIGQAYDLKKVSKEMVMDRRKRTGDLVQVNKSQVAGESGAENSSYHYHSLDPNHEHEY